MSLFSYKNLPEYPDRYDRNSNWVRVLPIHGRPIQTAELIEMQSILQDNLKQGMDTLFTNGSIITGLECVITSNNTNTVNVAISGGSIYVEGYIVKVEQDNLILSKDGTFDIGVVITEEIITENEDASLRDPIRGSSLLGLEGAARLVWTSSIEVNNADSFTIAKLVNGNLIRANNSNFTSFERLLARYTYDRNKNFCVKGLQISHIRNDSVIVSDRSKYQQLSNNVNQATSSAQEALTNAIAAQSNLDSLRERLSEAQAIANSSPTTNNNLVVQGLINAISQAQDTFNTLSSIVVARQAVLTKAQLELDKSRDLLVEKVTLLVNPGVAYVQGKRVDLANPTLLNINKDLEVQEVDTAVFVYGGTKATSIRTIGGDYSAASNKAFTFTFDKVTYQGSFRRISVSIDMTKVEANSISTFIDYLVAQFNSNTTPDDGIVFSSLDIPLSSSNIRSILKENCTLRKRSSNSLIFESTSISTQANQIEVSIAGTAFSLGNLTIDIATATLGGASTSSAFQLGFRPVDEIISLTAELEENLTPIVRGSAPGTADSLGDDTIIEITKVVQGSTEYVAGRDFTLQDQSKINWSASTSASIEPSPGTTYYVSFVYTQPLVQNTDFRLNREGDIIEFIGKTPGVNKRFYVDYSYFLSKSGVVTLSHDGVLSYVAGTSSSNPIPPTIAGDVLSLANVNIYADRVEINPIDCEAVSFANLRSLIEEVRQNSRMINSLSLQNEIRELSIQGSPDPIGLTSNVLTDLSDTDIDNSGFTATISPSTNGVTMGYSYKEVDLKLGTRTNSTLFNNSSGKTEPELSNNLVLLDYTEAPLIAQNRSTRSINVSSPLTNGRGHIHASPSLIFRSSKVEKFSPCDILLRKTSLVSRLSSTVNSIVGMISRHAITSLRVPSHITNTSLKNGLVSVPRETSEDSFINYVVDNVKAAPISVYLKIDSLPPDKPNFSIYLSGRLVRDVFPYNGTIVTTIGTNKYLTSNSSGVIFVRINLPVNLEPGTHIIELRGEHGYARTRISVYNTLLNHILTSSSYNWDPNPTDIVSDSLGNLEEVDLSDQLSIQSTTNLVSPGVLPSISVSSPVESQRFPYLFDGVAQSFEIPDTYFITSIETKFKTLPVQEIKAYLRNVDEFGPSRMAIINSSAQVLNVNSSLPNLWSKFTFQYPTPLNPGTYCFGLESRSAYSIYSSLIGEPDLLDNTLVGDQLYLRGDMYKSTNGYSIEAIREEDLTYKLNVASFTDQEAIVNLGSYGTEDAFFNTTSFTLNTKIVSPKNTSIKYEYRVGTGSWIEFIPNIVVCFGSVVSTFNLRARLETTDSRVSPAILLRDSSVSLYSQLPNSYYISKVSLFDSPYKTVNFYFKHVKSPNIIINVFYTPSLPTNEFRYSPVWKKLNFNSELPIDEGLDLYRAHYSIQEPTVLDETNNPRVAFRYRVEMINTSTTDTSSPLIFDMCSYVQ